MKGGFQQDAPYDPEDNQAALVFEKQKFRLPKILAVLFLLCFSALLAANLYYSLGPAALDAAAAHSYANDWPKAQATFDDPLRLYVTAPSQKHQMMLATFRFKYAVPNEAARLSDRFDLNHLSGLELDKDDLRLPRFLKEYCGAPMIEKKDIATLYVYEKCRPFKVAYHPRFNAYAVLFPPPDIEQAIAKADERLKNAAITAAVNAGAIALFVFYLRKNRRRGPSGR